MQHEPGAPFPVMPDHPILVVSETGDFEHNDGCKLFLSGPHLVFCIRAGETEVEVGVEVTQLLEAVGAYNKLIGS